MPTLKVAHIREQGQDLIIVPLDRSFEFRSEEEQYETLADIQHAATSAGLRGKVVPVWPSGSRLKFIAPQPWHPFLRSINLTFVRANLNRSLSW